MQIKLPIKSYSGVDGSSLSPTRCAQIVKIYEMLQSFGSKTISYIDIQEEAAKRNLFGKTKAKNAIRTFFPLLRKIDFVNYDGEFAACDCFTDLGKQFVIACRTIENVTEETINRQQIINRLEDIKKNAQREGLINMLNNVECQSHNIRIALRLLKEFGLIHWNEFLFALYLKEEGKSIEEAIDEIKKDRQKIASIEFVNEKSEALPNTCYSYLRSYLEEAGLICKVSSEHSKLLPEADLFYSQVNI